MVAHPSTDLLRDLNARKAIAFVWDFDRRRMAWASDAAVVFWQEGALTDLVGKAFGPRDAFVTSIEAVRPRLGPGEPATVRLQFNPEGRSLDAACRVRAFALKGERAGALVEIDEIAEPDADGAARRAAALLDQAPVALAAYHVDGRLAVDNAAARALFGPPEAGGGTLADRLGQAEAAATVTLRALGDGLYSRTFRIRTVHGLRQVRVTAQAAQDPKTGAPAIAVHFDDVDDTHTLWRDVAGALRGIATLSSDMMEKRSAVDAEPPAPDSTAEGPHRGERTARAAVEDFLEALPLALALVGENGRLLFLNSEAFRLLVKLMDRSEPMDMARRLAKQTLPGLFDERDAAEVTRALGDPGAAAGSLRSRPLALNRAWSSSGLVTLTLKRAALAGDTFTIAALAPAERPGHVPDTDDLAERLSRQNDFVARLSHELRTPLTAIIGFSEAMTGEQLGPVGNPKYRAYAADILKVGQYLLSLVNDLLDLSKVRAGKIKLDQSEINLAGVVDAVRDLLQPLAAQHDVTLRVRLPERLPHIVADERSLKQILINVLGNAIKFSRPGKKVTVTAAAGADGSVTLGVRDKGVGMSAADLAQALEPYGQVGRRPDGTPGGGTGLGLPLAKALAEANKADFAIASTPGKGTRVTLTFPSALVLAE